MTSVANFESCKSFGAWLKLWEKFTKFVEVSQGQGTSLVNLSFKILRQGWPYAVTSLQTEIDSASLHSYSKYCEFQKF